jgi:hypothetical protein
MILGVLEAAASGRVRTTPHDINGRRGTPREHDGEKDSVNQIHSADPFQESHLRPPLMTRNLALARTYRSETIRKNALGVMSSFFACFFTSSASSSVG